LPRRRDVGQVGPALREVDRAEVNPVGLPALGVVGKGRTASAGWINSSIGGFYTPPQPDDTRDDDDDVPAVAVG
jgi:hypothetical protein